MRSSGITNAAPYAAAPAVGVVGDLYFNSVSKMLYLSDGLAWSAPRIHGVGATITGAVATVAGTLYPINLAASLGNVAITLPTAPPQGSVVSFIRLDAQSFTSFARITAGGTDTIADASPFVFSMRFALVTFTYVGTTWYAAMTFSGGSGMYGATPSATFNPSMMARDNNGRCQVVDPAAAQDIATKNYVDLSLLDIALVSTTTTAVANMWYRGDPTSAGFVVTLPIAPVDGARVVVENVGTANLVSYGRGGAVDTIEGSTAVFPLSIGEWAELTYRAANTQWYMRRNLWNPTAGTAVRRDGAGRAQMVDPVAAQDIATKNYADNAAQDTGWLALPLGAAVQAFNAQAVQYRIRNGVVYYRGAVCASGGGSLVSGATTVTTAVPVAAQPTLGTNQYAMTAVATGSNAVSARAYIGSGSPGTLVVATSAVTPYVDLSGLSYPLG